MRYRSLGSTGLKVSELGLGCSSLGNSVFNYGDDEGFLKVLNFAFDNGVNFFDTAGTYAFGNSETLIGKAFSGKRDKIIISTKVGFLPSSLSLPVKNFIPYLGKARKIIAPFKKHLKRISKKNQDFSSKHIFQSIEQSLTRLQTDYIDIYLLHNPPLNIIQEGEVFKILDKLIADGKIRFYGISVRNIDDAVFCLNLPGISVLQVEFNLVQRDAASLLFPFIKEKKMGIVAKVPLARGFLSGTGKIKTGFLNYDEKLFKIIKANYDELEKKINKKIFPEAAVRYILKYPEVSTLIVGTTSLKHLQENIKTIEHPSLNDEELENIYSFESLSFGPIISSNIYQ